MTRFSLIALTAIALLSSAAQAQRGEPFQDRDPDRPIFVDRTVPCEVRYGEDCPVKRPKRICIERNESGRCIDWEEPKQVCEWDGGFGSNCGPSKPRRVCLERVDGHCLEWDVID